jgi:hypothetical protein
MTPTNGRRTAYEMLMAAVTFPLLGIQRYAVLRCLDGRRARCPLQSLCDSRDALLIFRHRLQQTQIILGPCTANDFLLLGQGDLLHLFEERPSNIPSRDCNACLRS